MPDVVKMGIQCTFKTSFNKDHRLNISISCHKISLLSFKIIVLNCFRLVLSQYHCNRFKHIQAVYCNRLTNTAFCGILYLMTHLSFQRQLF